MTDWHEAWSAELERLELSLTEAEDLLRARDPSLVAPPAQPAWRPQILGVLPGELLPRAMLLHERQLAVVHALTQRVVTTRQQLELADVVRRTAQRPEVPVYLDVSA